jgi:outer membrane protein assembly factor BamA
LQKLILIIILSSFFRLNPVCQSSDAISNVGTVADTLEYLIQTIQIDGNKVTKEKIILRELVFIIHQNYSGTDLDRLIQESRENLLNTELFNFVEIEKAGEPSSLDIFIHLVERWYIWPIPLFEHAERNLPTFLKNPDLHKTNYGLQLNWNNFRGMKEELSLKARLGYKEQFSLIYFKPNIDRDQKHGFGFGYNLFRQHEVRYKTFDNEPLFLKMEDDYLIETLSADLMYSYRPKIHLSSRVSLSYSETLFRNDSLHVDFLGIEKGKYLRNFNLALNTTIEQRDNIAYPLEGYMLSLSLLQRGLGFVSDYPVSKTILTILASHHQVLANRLYLENAAKIRLSKNEAQPYFLREALGGATYLRGFEYKLIDGNSYLLSVNNLKFALVPEIDHHFKWIPWEQFNRIHYSIYSNLFFDAAYVCSPVYEGSPDQLGNTWLYSFGIGFDFVTYYDQVFRLEFTENSIGQFGVFLHMETVFKRW